MVNYGRDFKCRVCTSWNQILIMKKRGKKKKGKDCFSLWKLMDLLVRVFCTQCGGLVEKATESGCKPDPNVTSLFLSHSRKKES